MLKFQEHISAKVKKANSIVGLIRRSFSFLDYHLFIKLYITFVRPHLEYTQSHMIENVQIRATKVVDGLRNLSYTERPRKLHLPTLVYRRARGDMIDIYKHFNSHDKATLSQSFQPSKRQNRKHNFQLVWKLSKDGVRGLQKNSFYYRTTQAWNNLPSEVVNAVHINAFKNMLDKIW